ncbi:hypothetical protein LV779_27205 [Streptomyces thinghirensis]|nr:hypothetical protein [Streptomyces thinghirensis]
MAKAEARANELARAAARADEQDQQRRLHDTVLTTLTMVSTGAITGHSTVLRDRAVADLRVIRALGGRQRTPRRTRPDRRPPTQHDHTPGPPRYQQRAPRPSGRGPDQPPLTVELGTVPVLLPLPRRVLTALVDAVAEALRTLPGTPAPLGAGACGTGRNRCDRQGAGRGTRLDPTTVPAHRRGLRESIRGRMVAVGGDALIETRPGDGVHVTLRWPR